MSPRRERGDISPPPVKRRRVGSPSGTYKTSEAIDDTHTPSEVPKPTSSARTTPASASAAADDATTLTIYAWNVNGIAPFVQRPITSFFLSSSSPSNTGSSSSGTTARTTLRAVLRRYAWPTFLLLQEVKISPADTATQRAVERSSNATSSNKNEDEDDGPAYVAHFSLPRDPHNARGFGRKVYGVCTLMRTDFAVEYVEKVRDVDWDLEGRFLVCETKPLLPSGRKLAVINVYAVNGTELAYRDSATGEVVGTRHDRKLAVHRLLQAEIRRLEERGFVVVLAGDLNIARAPIDGFPNLRTSPAQHCVNRADFERRFLAPPQRSVSDADGEDEGGLGMVDTFRALHPDRRAYTYYPRGVRFGASCDRVDMVLVSRALEHAVVEAGMHETPADRGPSDHVPLFARLRLGPARAQSKD